MPRPPPSDAAALRAGLARAGRVSISITGCSMHPTLVSGARVEIVPLAPRGPEVGEVVAVDAAGRIRIHRVTGVTTEGMVVAQGDGKLFPDEPLPTSRILGRTGPARRSDRIRARCLALPARLWPRPPHGPGPLTRALRVGMHRVLGLAVEILTD